jgi:hypothetical protein
MGKDSDSPNRILFKQHLRRKYSLQKEAEMEGVKAQLRDQRRWRMELEQAAVDRAAVDWAQAQAQERIREQTRLGRAQAAVDEIAARRRGEERVMMEAGRRVEMERTRREEEEKEKEARQKQLEDEQRRVEAENKPRVVFDKNVVGGGGSSSNSSIGGSTAARDTWEEQQKQRLSGAQDSELKAKMSMDDLKALEGKKTLRRHGSRKQTKPMRHIEDKGTLLHSFGYQPQHLSPHHPVGSTKARKEKLDSAKAKLKAVYMFGKNGQGGRLHA